MLSLFTHSDHLKINYMPTMAHCEPNNKECETQKSFSVLQVSCFIVVTHIRHPGCVTDICPHILWRVNYEIVHYIPRRS